MPLFNIVGNGLGLVDKLVNKAKSYINKSSNKSVTPSSSVKKTTSQPKSMVTSGYKANPAYKPSTSSTPANTRQVISVQKPTSTPTRVSSSGNSGGMSGSSVPKVTSPTVQTPAFPSAMSYEQFVGDSIPKPMGYNEYAKDGEAFVADIEDSYAQIKKMLKDRLTEQNLITNNQHDNTLKQIEADRKSMLPGFQESRDDASWNAEAAKRAIREHMSSLGYGDSGLTDSQMLKLMMQRGSNIADVNTQEQAYESDVSRQKSELSNALLSALNDNQSNYTSAVSEADMDRLNSVNSLKNQIKTNYNNYLGSIDDYEDRVRDEYNSFLDKYNNYKMQYDYQQNQDRIADEYKEFVTSLKKPTYNQTETYKPSTYEMQSVVNTLMSNASDPVQYLNDNMGQIISQLGSDYYYKLLKQVTPDENSFEGYVKNYTPLGR